MQAKTDRKDLASDGTCTIIEAAKFSGLSRSTLYGLMDKGQLAYAKVGKRRLIPRRALVELIEDHMVAC